MHPHLTVRPARTARGTAADEISDHLDHIVVVTGGVPHDVLQGVHPADTDIQLAGAEPFQSDGEPVGDLPAPREPGLQAV
jgi:hypothetical protein